MSIRMIGTRLQQWLPVARDVAQVLFYLAVTLVMVMTFLRAKKTLLQPLRTQVFKAQLRAFSELLRMLGGKSNVELQNDFGVGALVHANAMLYLHKYAQIFFDAQIDETTAPYSVEKCPVIKLDAGPDGIVGPAPHPNGAAPKSAEEPCDKLALYDKAARWTVEAMVTEIRLPRQYSDALGQFRKLMMSPVLPKPLVQLCDAFIKAVESNAEVLRSALRERCLKMENKYKTQGELDTRGYFWLRYGFIEKAVPLEEKSSAVVSYVRNYYTPDQVID